MASAQLGPELPAPFAVISEGHLRSQVDLPHIPSQERFSFGEVYEKKMCELIHRDLELGTDDRLCYIGDPKGSLVPLLQKEFCLLEPVTTVIPGHIHFQESPGHRMLPIRVASVGAEDFFRREASKEQPQKFDKILMHCAMNYLDETRNTFASIKKCLAPGGRIVIIHRPAPINTLPLFNDARERISETNQSYERYVRDLQACSLEVSWETECLPVRMSKEKWYAMIQDKFPMQTENAGVSDFEVNIGLRELSEGIMKYNEGMMDFSDRLVFIVGSECGEGMTGWVNSINSVLFFKPTDARRNGNHDSNGVQYQMMVTPDMKDIVRNRERKQLNDKSEKCSLFN